MAQKLGFQCKLFYNAGTYASPIWTEITRARDFNIPIADDMADVSDRDGEGSKEYLPALRDHKISGEVNWDRSNTALREVKQAYFRRQTIEVFAANGAVQAACEGLRMTAYVSNMESAQALADGVKVSLEFTPAGGSTYKPYWMEIETCDSSETTTSAGANVYYNESTSLATFIEGDNEYLGQSVHDYATGAALIYYRTDKTETAGS